MLNINISYDPVTCLEASSYLSLTLDATINRLLRKAKITESSAVVLKNFIACDGHDNNAILRIVTHAHHDHIYGLRESIKKTPFIGMTEATYDILVALGYEIPENKTLILNYDKEIKIRDAKISLHKARHIIGAAQVSVTDEEEDRFVYTGDFKLPSTPILEADLLIIEATYGNPNHVRPFKHEVEDLFVDLVKTCLAKGPVYIFGYHGKIQEAMEILRSRGIDAPFVMPRRVYKVTKAAMKHGLQVKEVFYYKSFEAEEIVKTGWYVFFTHINTARIYSKQSVTNIILSGWEFSGPLRQINEKTYLVALSDHADFEQLLEYVEKSKPKIVITDASREGSAYILAREIKKKLSIPAIALP